MADRYNAPWLLNHYCLNECPIGCRHSLSDEVVGIDRVTVKLLKSLKTEKLGDVKDTLLDIAADGKITEDEKPALQEVLAYPHLYHATDKIIFEHERERLEGVYAHFKDAVQDKVADAMQNVQGLTGQWSVDVLMDEREKFWLIDMAIAQRSAYWEMRPEGYAE